MTSALVQTGQAVFMSRRAAPAKLLAAPGFPEICCSRGMHKRDKRDGPHWWLYNMVEFLLGAWYPEKLLE